MTAQIQLMSCLWQACSCISLSLPKDQLLGHSLKTTVASARVLACTSEVADDGLVKPKQKPGKP